MTKINMLVASVLALCSFSCNTGGGTVNATDAPLRFVGRSCNTEKGVEFDWSGSYVDIAFKGSRLELLLSDSGRSFFNLTVDGERRPKFETQGDSMKVVLFDEPENGGKHHVRIQKATEGEYGHITLHSLSTDGRLLPVEGVARDLYIEFFGDSLTAGFGTESKSGDEKFSVDTENCLYTHAAFLAETFGADYNLVAHSGRGMVRNYGDKQPVSDPAETMSLKAFDTFDCPDSPKWDFSKRNYQPDALVIMLSTNDFSIEIDPDKKAFVERYVEMIQRLRAAYEDEQLPVLCVVHWPAAVELVGQVAERLERVAVADVSNNVYNDTTDRGACMHPNRSGQLKMAKITIAKFEELTGFKRVADVF